MGEKAAHTVVSFRMWAPARSVASCKAKPWRNWRSSRRRSTTCEGARGLKYWPPACSRSSATMTLAPASARSRAADRPAGPAPTTSTSQATSSAAAASAPSKAPATRLGQHLHAGGDLGQAGALVRPAIDRDQAVEADAHAAERPARRARAGLAQGDDVGGRQGGGDGLAGQRLDLGAVEADTDRRAGRPHVRVLQAHGGWFTMAGQRSDMKKFRGTYTVLITPFTADGKKVDEAALKRLVDFQIAEGIHGLIPLGSTGEFLSVTPDERRQIVDIVVKQAAGRVPVLIGTGAEWTDEVVRTSREAESMGADGVMIIPPFYSVPTDDELYAHYKKVSDAIGIPVMVYNNPATANVDMQPELIARLAQIPNCRYVKESTLDPDAGARHHPAGRRQDDGVRGRAGLRIVLARRRGLGGGLLQRHSPLVGRAVRAGRRQARHGCRPRSL